MEKPQGYQIDPSAFLELNIEAPEVIYRSYIHSNFLYCPLIWMFRSKANNTK